MKNVILTWIGGDDFCKLASVKAFVNSFKLLANIDLVVFTHQMPEDFKQWLEKSNIKVVPVPREIIPLLVRDRFLIFWDWLVENGQNYKSGLVVDSKDVIFQKDPFCYKVEDKNVIFVSEGKAVEDSEWNKTQLLKFGKDIPSPFAIMGLNSPVLNSGVIIGDIRELKYICFLIWSTHLKSVSLCSEQACLNYLYNFLQKEKTYHVSHPQNESFCITGEGIKNGLFAGVTFKDGLFLLNSEPYCIVHQWDRLEQYYQAIVNKYEKG